LAIHNVHAVLGKPYKEWKGITKNDMIACQERTILMVISLVANDFI
jgi:hypothetical protein